MINLRYTISLFNLYICLSTIAFSQNIDTVTRNAKSSQKKLQQFEVVGGSDGPYDYVSLEKFPKYNGGTDAMNKFFSKNFHFPVGDEATSGKIIVEALIDQKGKVASAVIQEGISESLDREALRVVKSMPKWEPGVQAGKKIRVKVSIPIKLPLNTN
ncbi:MAG TPA: TonB family protein [Pedobacter sp.]|uniref:TonB family protein n=1 Tax=Pedobacter sp. TaxID=1411316 RepID=UPI002C5D9F96|nr:TonB family protein [Pedobacter sp.]HMI01665.1 TonB family protein [Pedobacter sp.]